MLPACPPTRRRSGGEGWLHLGLLRIRLAACRGAAAHPLGRRAGCVGEQGGSLQPQPRRIARPAQRGGPHSHPLLALPRKSLPSACPATDDPSWRSVTGEIEFEVRWVWGLCGTGGSVDAGVMWMGQQHFKLRVLCFDSYLHDPPPPLPPHTPRTAPHTRMGGGRRPTTRACLRTRWTWRTSTTCTREGGCGVCGGAEVGVQGCGWGWGHCLRPCPCACVALLVWCKGCLDGACGFANNPSCAALATRSSPRSATCRWVVGAHVPVQ